MTTMKALLSATAWVSLVGLVLAPASGTDFVNITFESGSLGNGDGWELWSDSGLNLAEIGSTGRSFLTGTAGNDEALFITPTNDPGVDVGQFRGRYLYHRNTHHLRSARSGQSHFPPVRDVFRHLNIRRPIFQSRGAIRLGRRRNFVRGVR